MRIGIDCRLWGQSVGVGRYTRILVKNIANLDSSNEYFLFVRKADENEVAVEFKKKPNFKIVVADVQWHSLDEQIKFPQILNKQNLDLMHFTYFSVPVLYGRPFIITVHDLIVNEFGTGRASTLPRPLYMAKKLGYHVVLGSAISRAKKIIVPTKAVASRILEVYPLISKDKIVVTHEGGFEEKVIGERGKVKNVEGEYLLRVGNYYPHKNVEGLLKAFSLLLNQPPTPNRQELKLVLVGKKDYFYQRMERLVLKLGIKDSVIFLDNVDDDDLAKLYKSASATVVPSFAEGFSLTCVEAMSCGSIVVASDILVHREVCGDAAIYFDPTNPLNIAERLGFALNLVDKSKNELIEQGKKQSNKFSWKKMAEETLSVYNQVLSPKF